MIQPVNFLDLHTFCKDGQYYLYDAQSSYKATIDQVLNDILCYREYPLSKNHHDELLKKFDNHQVEIALKKVERLLNKGKINFYQKLEKKSKIIPLNSLDLCLIQDCNMKCTYCYAHYGTYSEAFKTSKMEDNTAQNAIDFILKQSKNYPFIKITFFGGEPLMNFNLIKDIVSYANTKAKESGKKVIYDMVTNGILLNDEVCKYLIKNHISIILSLDGTKEINDKTKLFGKSHYDFVMKNIKPYIGKLHITTRSTTCKTNYQSIIPIAEHFYNLGIDAISFEEIGAGMDNNLNFTDEEKFEKVFPEYEKAFDYVISNIKSRKRKIFFPYTTYLFRLLFASRNFYGCSSGRNHVSIASNGDIYPCHRLLDTSEFVLGNVNKHDFQEESLQKYHNNDINQMNPCKECFVRFICGGDCLRANYMANRDISRPDNNRCIAIKKMAELAIVASFKVKRWQLIPLTYQLINAVYRSPGYILKDRDKELIRTFIKLPWVK